MNYIVIVYWLGTHNCKIHIFDLKKHKLFYSYKNDYARLLNLCIIHV